MPRKTRARRRRAGMTLVEIMIVVIIMALIATAVGMAVLPAFRSTQIEETRADLATIRSAVVLLQVQGSDCPSTGSELAATGVLDGDARARDAWDQEFLIECDGRGVHVRSAGPDRQPGTEDDVR